MDEIETHRDNLAAARGMVYAVCLSLALWAFIALCAYLWTRRGDMPHDPCILATWIGLTLASAAALILLGMFVADIIDEARRKRRNAAREQATH